MIFLTPTPVKYISSGRKSRDGGYILSGSSGYDLYLLKISNEGDSVWAGSYGGPNYRLYDAVQLPDYHYLALTGSNVLVVDQLGDSVKSIPLSEYATTFGITADSNYIVGGSSGHSVYLAQINGINHLEWERAIPIQGETYYFQTDALTGMHNGNIAYCGYVDSGGYSVGVPLLGETSCCGDSNWVYIFANYQRGTEFYSMRQLRDSSFVFCGTNDASFKGDKGIPDPGAALAHSAMVLRIPPQDFSSPDYVCGDADGDGLVNLVDALYLIASVYEEGPAPPIRRGADVNSDCQINLLDILALISYIYVSPPTVLECP